MKGFRTAVAVASLAIAWLAGCNDYNTSIQYNTGPPIGSLAPSGVAAGSPAFQLTVNAQSLTNPFLTKTVIRWNGKDLATTMVDNVTLTANVPASYVANPGTAIVNTFTPQSGNGMNGLSNSIYFYIYGTPNPVPTITSVSPSSVQACGSNCTGSLTITVDGTNFLPASNNGGSSVTFQDSQTPQHNPTALAITSFSATEIKATVPGSFYANPDMATIQVLNPGSGPCNQPSCASLAGGGASNPITFNITGGSAMAIAEEAPAISQDGRYVAYASEQNQINQILLKDTCQGVSGGCSANVRVVSAAPDGTAGNADSHNAVVTPDGRYVAFSSAATNLVEGAPAGRQVYLRDTCIGAEDSCKPLTTLISTDPNGALTGTESILPSISASGRFVAFVAITPSAAKTPAGAAAGAHAAPNSGMRQVFVRDTCLGAANCTAKTTRISMMPGDVPANGSKPAGPTISGLAKQIALVDEKTATVFTPTVAVDDRVFLAVPKSQ